MPTVLVVDDTPVDRRIAGGLIEEDPTATVSYAENGADAIEKLAQSMPDLVVTDLQMPELDGLQLVQRIRMIYPKLPVILMTAKGSEAIAMEALEQGAASYVPKSQLNERLRETVQDVLSMAGAERTHNALLACQDRIEIGYSLGNDAALIDTVTELIQQFLEGMDLFDHTENCRVVIAVREALLNALYRGNLEITSDHLQEASEDLVSGRTGIVDERRTHAPFSERKVFLDLRIDRQEAKFTIRDEGRGFDHKSFFASESTSETIDMDRGRGLRLMQSFMNEVAYNEAGNEVTLVKRP